MRRRLILMRHGDVSYVDEAGAPVHPEDVPLTARGREQAAAARDALANVDFDLVARERPAADARDGRDRRARPRGRALARAGGVARRPARRDPAGRARGGVRGRAAGEGRGAALPRRRVARRGARPRPPRAGAAARAATGTPRSPSSTAASTGSSSPTRSPATAPTSAPSSRRPRASTCSTLGDDGWIVRTVNYVPYDPLHPARTTTMEHLWEQLKPFLDERQ